MNCKLISTTDPLFSLPFLSSSSSSSPATSRINSLPTRLSFNTHFKKQAFPVTTSSGSQRFRINAVAAAAATAPTETLYDLLGVPETGSLPEIKRAYKRMALKYHPDVSPPERTEEYTRRFIQVQEAYETLSDPQSRLMYDTDMANGFGNVNVAFAARRGRRTTTRFDPWAEEMEGWRSMWQTQINDLKKKSVMKNRVDSRGRVTWGSRVRKQRSEPSVNGFE